MLRVLNRFNFRVCARGPLLAMVGTILCGELLDEGVVEFLGPKRFHKTRDVICM